MLLCFFLQVRGSEQTQPAAEPHAPAVTAEAARDGAGGAGFSLAVDGESVADGLAKTMNSPWKTPPAVVVDMEPLRDVRQLMIQASICSFFCRKRGWPRLVELK